MKRKKYIITGIFSLIALLVVAFIVLLDGFSGMGNPNGNAAPDYPFFITTEDLTIKKILLPKGTKLTYEEHFFREGQQSRMMNEEKLTDVELPEGKTVEWGGVPVYMFKKFFNSEMQGYSVYADFSKLHDDQKNKFAERWQSCGGEIGVLVKNTDNWAFDQKNISDVSDCGVTYQRFFKEDLQQQRFLDKLYNEMKKNGQQNMP